MDKSIHKYLETMELAKKYHHKMAELISILEKMEVLKDAGIDFNNKKQREALFLIVTLSVKRGYDLAVEEEKA